MDDIVKNKIIEINDLLLKYQKEYYIDSAPSVTDAEYDKLFDELVELEKNYPDYKLKESATSRVGSDLSSDFEEEQHSIPVLSLDKAYTIEEVLNWKNKTEEGSIISAEEKIDGASIVLYYDNGVLEKALTRGNGYIGNNVTKNVKTIGSVPLKIDYKKKLVVRGEVYIPKSNFEELNNQFGNIYANARNLASGSLRRKNSKESASVPLQIFVYEGFFEDNFSTYKEIIEKLKSLNFRINPASIFISSTEELELFIERETALRKKNDYEIDGLVFKFNSISKRDELGYTDHHPRWAIAYKFESPMAETVIEKIDLQVGRTGRVTPVARVKKVELNGSQISNVTLHNQDYIDLLEVGIGDKVNISKRGDVIPAVEEVLEKSENSKVYKIEEFCPCCKTKLVKIGAHHFCTNKNCLEQIKGKLKFFISKGQMDLDGFGSETMEFLVVNKFVKTIQDIYTFDYDKLFQFDGYKDKKINIIKNSVLKSKEQPYEKVLSSLGFSEIGPKVVELLVENKIDNVDALIQIAKSKDENALMKIKGIGESTINAIFKEFTNVDNLKLIEDLKSIGLKFKAEKKEQLISDIFLNQTWVVTGSFDNFKPRDLAMVEVKKRGGKVASAISNSTTHLLAGKEAGSKLEKAKNLGVQIIDETQFLEMIGK